MGTGVGGAVAQLAERRERYLNHSRAQTFGDFCRSIIAVGIRQNDFVRPQYAIYGILDLVRLVEGDDGRRNLCHGIG